MTEIKKDIKDMMANLVKSISEDKRKELFSKYTEQEVAKIKNEILNDIERYSILSPVIHKDIIEVCFEEYEGFSFFVINFDMIENHFDKIIEKDEGMPCSADKTRTIMKELQKYLLSNKKIYPKRNYEGEYTYHLPVGYLKDTNNVISLFEALYSFKYGKNEKYIKFIKGYTDYKINKNS